MPTGGRYCCVANCKASSHNKKPDHEIHFFKIPKVKTSHGKQMEEVTTRRRRAWIAAIRRPTITFNQNLETRLVCSRHFYKGKPAYEMYENDPDWAPSLHLGHSELQKPDPGRHQRWKERSERKKQSLQMKKEAAKASCGEKDLTGVSSSGDWTDPAVQIDIDVAEDESLDWLKGNVDNFDISILRELDMQSPTDNAEWTEAGTEVPAISELCDVQDSKQMLATGGNSQENWREGTYDKNVTRAEKNQSLSCFSQQDQVSSVRRRDATKAKAFFKVQSAVAGHPQVWIPVGWKKSSTLVLPGDYQPVVCVEPDKGAQMSNTRAVNNNDPTINTVPGVTPAVVPSVVPLVTPAVTPLVTPEAVPASIPVVTLVVTQAVTPVVMPIAQETLPTDPEAVEEKVSQAKCDAATSEAGAGPPSHPDQPAVLLVLLKSPPSPSSKDINNMQQNDLSSTETQTALQTVSLTGYVKNGTGQKPFVCGVCGKSYYTEQRLQIHMRLHTVDRPFACDICNKRLTTAYLLHVHKMGHRREATVYACEKCGKTCSSWSTLNAHKKPHSGLKRYTCRVCNKGHKKRDHLAGHQRIHTGSKPYVCNICGKASSSKCNLKAHMVIHTGHKPFDCFLCDKSFSTAACLAVHLRSHTGQKPFICCVCGKAFALSNSLKTHMKTHPKC